jgi:acetyltransferase-like isoleucine patch superfamily enzyme
MKQIVRYFIQFIRFPKASFEWPSMLSGDCVLKGKAKIKRHATLLSSQVGEGFEIGERSICVHLKAEEACSVGRDSEVIHTNLGKHVSLGKNVVLHSSQVGNHSYLAQDVLGFHVTIGRFCSIGPRVIFGHGDHPTDRMSSSPEFYSPSSATGHSFVTTHGFEEFAPIHLGHDVWLGAQVYVKQGVKIGHGAIVAAGSVVTKDVAPYAIVGGVPAKLIKMRFNEIEIAHLLKLKWWDWDDDVLKENRSIFSAKFNV